MAIGGMEYGVFVNAGVGQGSMEYEVFVAAGLLASERRLWVKVGGSWRQVLRAYAKVAGTWRQSAAWAKVSGAWERMTA